LRQVYKGTPHILYTHTANPTTISSVDISSTEPSWFQKQNSTISQDFQPPLILNPQSSQHTRAAQDLHNPDARMSMDDTIHIDRQRTSVVHQNDYSHSPQATMPSMMLPTHPQHYQPFVVFAVKEPTTFDDWVRFIKEASALGVEMRVTSRFLVYSLHPPTQSRQQLQRQARAAIRGTTKSDPKNIDKPWIKCFFYESGCKTSMKMPDQITRHARSCEHNPTPILYRCRCCGYHFTRPTARDRHEPECFLQE